HRRVTAGAMEDDAVWIALAEHARRAHEVGLVIDDEPQAAGTFVQEVAASPRPAERLRDAAELELRPAAAVDDLDLSREIAIEGAARLDLQGRSRGLVSLVATVQILTALRVGRIHGDAIEVGGDRSGEDQRRDAARIGGSADDG